MKSLRFLLVLTALVATATTCITLASYQSRQRLITAGEYEEDHLFIG